MHATLRFSVPVLCSLFNPRFLFLPVLFVRSYSSADFLLWLQGLLFVLPALTFPFTVLCPASLPQLSPSTAEIVSIPTPALGERLLAGAGVYLGGRCLQSPCMCSVVHLVACFTSFSYTLLSRIISFLVFLPPIHTVQYRSKLGSVCFSAVWDLAAAVWLSPW